MVQKAGLLVGPASRNIAFIEFESLFFWEGNYLARVGSYIVGSLVTATDRPVRNVSESSILREDYILGFIVIGGKVQISTSLVYLMVLVWSRSFASHFLLKFSVNAEALFFDAVLLKIANRLVLSRSNAKIFGLQFQLDFLSKLSSCGFEASIINYIILTWRRDFIGQIFASFILRKFYCGLGLFSGVKIELWIVFPWSYLARLYCLTQFLSKTKRGFV